MKCVCIDVHWKGEDLHLACLCLSFRICSPTNPLKQVCPWEPEEGSYSRYTFAISDSGSEPFWSFFLEHIPPVRHVLLLQNEHVSHTFIKSWHMLTKSICCAYEHIHVLHMCCNPLMLGCLIRSRVTFQKPPASTCLSTLKGWLQQIAWPLLLLMHGLTHSPVLTLGVRRFKKAGVYTFNPREVSDHQLRPSKALWKALCSKTQPCDTHCQLGAALSSPPSSEKCYQENYMYVHSA